MLLIDERRGCSAGLPFLGAPCVSAQECRRFANNGVFFATNSDREVNAIDLSKVDCQCVGERWVLHYLAKE